MSDSQCSQPRLRKKIPEMLAETLPHWISLSHLDEALVHLTACEPCLSEFPTAASELRSTRWSLISEASETVSRLMHQYLAFKHQQAAREFEGEYWQGNLRDSLILAKLVELGDAITTGVMDSMMGESVEWVAFRPYVDENEETRIGQFGYFEFISGLPREVQVFLAAAAIADSIVKAPRMSGKDDNSDLLDWLSSREYIDASRLLSCIEDGAGQHLNRYLEAAKEYRRNEAQKNISGAGAEPKKALDSEIRDLIGELRKELLTDFSDLSDSMKATQMEMLLRAGESSRGTDPLPALRKALGGTYDQLDQESQGYLKTAESIYNDKSLSHNGHLATFMLVMAYETEATIRLKNPVLKELAQMGKSTFPEDGPVKLIENGKPNPRLALGQFLHALRNESEVRGLLVARGLDVDRILKTGTAVMSVRNAVAHGDFKPHHTDHVRQIMLGTDANAFLALMPKDTPTG